MPKHAEQILDRIPESVRELLDSWKFWIGVAYLGIAACIVALYILFTNQQNETAKRVAIQRAGLQSQVTQCVNGVKNAPVVDGFIEAQRAVVVNGILTTTAALQASPQDDPLRHIRLASLARLNRALTNVDKLSELITSTTPARVDCNHLARSLGIPKPFPK